MLFGGDITLPTLEVYTGYHGNASLSLRSLEEWGSKVLEPLIWL